MDIERVIDEERLYFSPMLERELRCSEEEKLLWRSETIRERQARISREVFELCEGQVKYGPFSGMHISPERWWGDLDLGSQCLGLYEREILNFIEAIEPGEFSFFVDIGAADGYYTTGVLLSQKVPEALCYELSSEGRAAIKSSWELNGKPGKLTIEGPADVAAITAIQHKLRESSLVFIDIEGGEFALLTESALDVLSKSTIILEVHNWIPNFLEMYERFLRAASERFCIERIAPVTRDLGKLPELRDFTDDNRLLLVSERRPCLMRFLKLTPKG